MMDGGLRHRTTSYMPLGRGTFGPGGGMAGVLIQYCGHFGVARDGPSQISRSIWQSLRRADGVDRIGAS